MKETIIVGIISGVVTLLVCLINNYYQQRRADIEQDKRLVETQHSFEKNVLQIQAATQQTFDEMNSKIQQSIAVLDCKFDELTRKVEKHNCLIERTYKLEKDSEVISEKIKVINHRIEDLEKKG